MTPRERVLAVLNRRIPDRLPRELKLTSPLMEAFKARTGSAEAARAAGNGAGSAPAEAARAAGNGAGSAPAEAARAAGNGAGSAPDDPAEYFDLEVRDVFFSPPDDMAARAAGNGAGSAPVADFSRYYPEGLPPLLNPAGWEVGEWGVGQVPGSQLHFIHIENPMKNLSSLADLREYPFPDLTRPVRHAHLESQVKALHDRGLFVIGFMEWTIFEIAWHMRGMENLFADLVFNPEFATYLLDKITEARCFQAKRHAEADVDMIKIGDDVGTQRSMLMSPAAYREWFKPRHAAVVRAARQVRSDIPVCYHSDGDCWDIIPDLIEIGVTVLNPVQPECLDIAAVKREFGRDLVFWGGIGTQTTMPFSSPDEVYATVHRTIDTLGPAGYFPCPTHVLEPEVPWENILAYLRAVEEYE